MSSGDNFRLIVRSGPNPGRTFALTQPVITLGRDVTNDVVVNDSEISRRHTRLTQQASGGYSADDLGSTNGTTVNGERLTGPRLLRPGDILGLGETVTLEFEVAPDESPFPIGGGPTVVSPLGVPELPPEPSDEQPKSKKGMVLALAGCGCLLLAACTAVGLFVAYYIYESGQLCSGLGVC